MKYNKVIVAHVLMAQCIFAANLDAQNIDGDIFASNQVGIQEYNVGSSHDMNIAFYYGHFLSSLSVSYVPVGKPGVYQGFLYQAGIGMAGPWASVGPFFKFESVSVNTFLPYHPVSVEFCKSFSGGGRAPLFLPGVGVCREISEHMSVWLSLGTPHPTGIGVSVKL